MSKKNKNKNNNKNNKNNKNTENKEEEEVKLEEEVIEEQLDETKDEKKDESKDESKEPTTEEPEVKSKEIETPSRSGKIPETGRFGENEGRPPIGWIMLGVFAVAIAGIIIASMLGGSDDKESKKVEDKKTEETLSADELKEKAENGEELTDEERAIILSDVEGVEQARAELEGDPNYAFRKGHDSVVADIRGQSEVYVLYFSPICGHCKTETPDIVKGLKEAQKEQEDRKPLFVQYDVTNGAEDIFSVAKITGVPTLVKYEKGKEVYRTVGAGYSSLYYKDIFLESEEVLEVVDKRYAGEPFGDLEEDKELEEEPKEDEAKDEAKEETDVEKAEDTPKEDKE